MLFAARINAEKVPENAREICINWMLKIASIRELLPRIYVEASILHCNEFLQNGLVAFELMMLACCSVRLKARTFKNADYLLA